MSKQVKNLIMKELTARFGDVDTVAVISPRGIDGHKNNAIRRRLRAKGLRMTVVKNSLARKAVGGKLKGFDRLLDGPSAVVYGQASAAVIARTLLDAKKADEKLEIRGLFFDGEIYEGDKGIEQASKLPTREEAIANVLAALMGPARQLAGAIRGPGAKLAAAIKAIEDKKGGEAAPAAA